MIDLKKIEERCKEATPGPWDYETPSGEGAHVFCSLAGDDSDREPPTLILTDPQSAGDVAFIQEARTDLPALVDWVKRAAKLIEEAPTNSDAQTKARRELLSELEGA